MKKLLVNIFRWFFLGLYNIFTLIPKYLFIGILCLIDPKRGSVLKYKGKPVIPAMMIGLTLTVYFICIFLSSKWYVQRLKINYLTTDIIESTKILEQEKYSTNNEEYIPDEKDEYSNISYMEVDFRELVRKNSDTVGWLKVNNTNVNYSVVKTNDNEYYLNHDFNKNDNYTGWIFGDFRDDFEYFGTNTIIYGHNMTNRTMFGSLVWCLKEKWYQNEDNYYIKLSTPTSNTVWRIFSIYQIKPEVYYLKTYFETDQAHQEFIKTIRDRSIYDFNIDVSTNDKILTLSTCTDDGTQRIVIHAKMIKAEYR